MRTCRHVSLRHPSRLGCMHGVSQCTRAADKDVSYGTQPNRTTLSTFEYYSPNSLSIT